MMSTTHRMDFKIAEDGKSIHITRQYAGALSVVWDAWTNAQVLDQWWAPKPWKSETKSFDFKEGGRWHYCMKGPEGEETWGLFFYEEIEPLAFYRGNDKFADEDGHIQNDFPGMHWQVEFQENELGTLVDIHIQGESADDIQKHIEMGFREGFEMGLNNLDELLEHSIKND